LLRRQKVPVRTPPTWNGSAEPDVSVVVPCWNLGRYLPEAVDSVLAQTYDRYELIIVDDGSTDPATLKLLERYAEAGITVVHKPHSGLSASKNAGVEVARGRYIVFVDADDSVMPLFLERTVPKLDELDGVGVVTTGAEIFGRRRGVYEPPPHDLVTLLWRNVVAGSGSLFRRVCWEQIGGYDVDGVEDWDFWIGMVEHGWTWEVVPETLYRFRLRRGSLSGMARGRREELLRELVRRHEETYRAHVADIMIQMDRALFERRQMWPLPWLRWLLRRV
jgi:glycosyltransferase involved in cell wall biosynthesis